MRIGIQLARKRDRMEPDRKLARTHHGFVSFALERACGA